MHLFVNGNDIVSAAAEFVSTVIRVPATVGLPNIT